jgi:hypothetical protein
LFTASTPLECFYVDFNIIGCNAPPSIRALSAYGTNLDFAIYTQRAPAFGEIQYMIIAEARVLDTNRAIVNVDDGNGALNPLTAKVTIPWIVNNSHDDGLGEDMSDNLNWPCIAKIVQLHVSARYMSFHGELGYDQMYDSYLQELPNPLKELGIMGWPIRVAGEGSAFRRRPEEVVSNMW